MAITATRVGDSFVMGPYRATVTDIALDASYPTGGESVTPANLGLSEVVMAWVNVSAAATTTVNVANATYDLTNKKVKLFDETPAEVANASDLAGLSVRVFALGRA